MKKIACYCLTRNLYPLIWPSLNSMLERGNVDKVCILAEDDEIAPAVQLPEQVEVLNVSGQKFFSAAGPNYLNKWTYMAMMKTVMSEIFPTMSRVLTIDRFDRNNMRCGKKVRPRALHRRTQDGPYIPRFGHKSIYPKHLYLQISSYLPLYQES